MRVALIVPCSTMMNRNKLENYGWREMREFQARMRLWSCPSLSLLTVAAMLPDDYVVDYIDLNLEEMPDKEYDMAFFSPSTSQAYSAYKLADSLRGKKTKVIMGGVHVSVLPEEALKHADVVFIGESENTFKAFLNDVKNNSLLPVYEALDYPGMALSPVPRYELVRGNRYKSVPLQTSRGCPHQCEFCISSALYGKVCRRKSVAQIRKELETIIHIWPRPFVFFTDDNIFTNDRYSARLIDLIKEYSIQWYAFSDAGIGFRPDFLEKIRNAGCRQLLIGFESLSENNLKLINRSGWKKDRRIYYSKIIETIQSFKIGVVGSFMLGFEDDTADTFNYLYDFIEKTRLYATNITVLTPFPGTNLYKRYKSEGIILVEDWERYNGFELTFVPRNMSCEEFEDWFGYLYKKINSENRIGNMLNSFKDIMHAEMKGRNS